MADISPAEAQALQPNNEAPNSPNYNVEELETKLGVSTAPTQEQVNQVQPTDNTQNKPEEKSKQELDFAKQFEQYFGTTIEEAKATIQQLSSFRADVGRERQISTLKQEWGQDYEVAFQAVQEKWNTLPPEQQKALDNLDGARLLYARIIQERSQSNQGNPNVNPRWDKSKTAPSRGTPQIRWSEMIELAKNDPKEYQRMQPQFEAAIQAGTLIRDI